MPMSEYEKERMMPEVISRAERKEARRQRAEFRTAALKRLQKAIRYAQMQKNDPTICDRYTDQRYWDGYLAALNEVKSLL